MLITEDPTGPDKYPHCRSQSTAVELPAGRVRLTELISVVPYMVVCSCELDRCCHFEQLLYVGFTGMKSRSLLVIKTHILVKCLDDTSTRRFITFGERTELELSDRAHRSRSHDF